MCIMDKCLTIIVFDNIFRIIRKISGRLFIFFQKNLILAGLNYFDEHWNENIWELNISKIADNGYEFVHLA